MSLSSDLTSLDTAIANVANDIVGSIYLGDVPAANMVTLTPANIGNGGWTTFKLTGGGDATLTPSSVDGILCKLILSGNVNIVTDTSHTVSRIQVTVGSAGGTQVFNHTQHSTGNTCFYEEIFLFYADITGTTDISAIKNFNTTFNLGSYSPGTATPTFYVSGGFDYTSPATYSASNNFTLTEFRLICD